MPIHRGADIIYNAAKNRDLAGAATVSPDDSTVKALLDNKVDPQLNSMNRGEAVDRDAPMYGGAQAVAEIGGPIQYYAFKTKVAGSYRYVVYTPIDNSILPGPSHALVHPHRRKKASPDC